MVSHQDRIAGGIVGLLVGDALGVPYEFHAPASLPPAEAIEFTPPAGFARAHRGTPPGTWSDDGAQALCLLASLLECGAFDATDFSRRLLRWGDEGYLAVEGRVFDIGITTGAALRAIRSGTAALDAGPKGERDNGNGSLMRVLPLALWHRGSDADLVRDARLQSQVTHGHVRSQVCCAVYCLWARRILAGLEGAWSDAVAAFREVARDEAAAIDELDRTIRPDAPPSGTGSGYVVDSLRSARLTLAAGGYEQVVKAAVLLGNDTDTTACIAGGLAGVRDGVDAIPERWRTGLRGRELYEPLLDRLIAIF